MTRGTGQANPQAARQRLLATAVKIQVISLVWVAIEASLGILAAVQSGALSTSAFSIDSAVELISGIVVFTRLVLERVSHELPDWVERTASTLVGLCLLGLAAWVSWSAGTAAAVRQAPDFSLLALSVAVLSSLITPLLAVRKRKLADRLHSPALRGDAACTMICAFMAMTLLLGLLLQWTGLGWWVDPLCAIAILFFVTSEGFEALTAGIRRTGAIGHHHH